MLICTDSFAPSACDSVPYTVSVVDDVTKSPGVPVSGVMPVMATAACGGVVSTFSTNGVPGALWLPAASTATAVRLCVPSASGVVGV